MNYITLIFNFFSNAGDLFNFLGKPGFKLGLKIIIVLAALAGFGYFLWDWHYSEISAKDKLIAQKEQKIENLIKTIRRKDSNLSTCFGEIKALETEIEIMKIEQEVYDVEEPQEYQIKDTSPDGYFIY